MNRHLRLLAGSPGPTRPNVRRLVRRGYTEEQIGKIWSGNLLRVMAEVEKVAKQLQ